MSATNRINRKTDYITEYQWAREDPNSFWETQSQAIDWFESPKTILQTDDNGIERWFPDGVMNTCWLALDYHCENGRGDNTALIYDSPVTGTQVIVHLQSACVTKWQKTAGMLATTRRYQRRSCGYLHADDS